MREKHCINISCIDLIEFLYNRNKRSITFPCGYANGWALCRRVAGVGVRKFAAREPVTEEPSRIYYYRLGKSSGLCPCVGRRAVISGSRGCTRIIYATAVKGFQHSGRSRRPNESVSVERAERTPQRVSTSHVNVISLMLSLRGVGMCTPRSPLAIVRPLCLQTRLASTFLRCPGEKKM